MLSKQKILPCFFLLCLLGCCWLAKADPAAGLNLTPQQMADILGWQSTPPNQTICAGYYKELPILTPPGSREQQINVQADSGILRQKNPNELQGHVSITQINKQITSDRALTYLSKNNQIERIDLFGNVVLRQTGMLAVGSQAQVNVPEQYAVLDDAIFRYQIPLQPITYVYDQQHQLQSVQVTGSNYRGQAKKLEQTEPKHFQFHNITVTTCNPYSKAWELKATKLNLDRDQGVGTSYNTFLLIHGIPVLYTPYFRFSIDNRRKSGFLMPGYSYSQNSGATFNIPYYWNMAPNYDMTIQPNIITKRGVKLDNLFRYLDKLGSGEAYFSFLPKDNAFAQFKNAVADGEYPAAGNPYVTDARNELFNSPANRYEFAWQDNTQYNPYLQTAVNMDYVSDSYYLQDFPNAPMRSNSIFSALFPTTQLTQDANISYASEHWSVNTEVENFQTLHPLNLGGQQDQYARLPELDVTGIYPSLLPHLNLNIETETTHFVNPLFEQNFSTNLPGVTGYRSNLAPAMDLYLAKAWGYLDPKVTLTQTFYELVDPIINPTDPALSQRTAMQRFVPIFDYDTGLYFDRTVNFAQQDYTQTLEPRLFYLYAPYVDQDAFPTFDTSLNPVLTFDQMFSINRFQGYDRYGDANQVTLGLQSRLLSNITGNDVLDLGIGQIYYFEDRRVSAPGESSAMLAEDQSRVSPLVGSINWQFRQYWNLTGNAAYDTQQHALQSSTLNLNYSFDTNHYLTSGLAYVKDGETPTLDLKQANFGIVWPITLHWQTIDGIAYNISRNFPQTYLYGLQYNSCCWAMRFIGSQQFLGFKSNSTQPLYNPGFYLQFVLTGLTSGGGGLNSDSPSNLISYAIPGYTDQFGLAGTGPV